MENILPDDEDVQEEESIVKQQAAEGIVDSSIAVQIRGLVKIYAGATKIGCCKCKRTSPYHALKVKLITCDVPVRVAQSIGNKIFGEEWLKQKSESLGQKSFASF